MAKRGIEADSFELDRLVTASEGFSGAELEQAIVAGLYSAHAQGKELNTQYLLGEIQQTKPLSVVMAEKIADLGYRPHCPQ